MMIMPFSMHFFCKAVDGDGPFKQEIWFVCSWLYGPFEFIIGTESELNIVLFFVRFSIYLCIVVEQQCSRGASASPEIVMSMSIFRNFVRRRWLRASLPRLPVLLEATPAQMPAQTTRTSHPPPPLSASPRSQPSPQVWGRAPSTVPGLGPSLPQWCPSPPRNQRAPNPGGRKTSQTKKAGLPSLRQRQMMAR